MKMLIGIPALNEAQIIGKVLYSLPRKMEGIKSIDVLVVDDGSGDETAQIASSAGAIVVSHILNRGLGGALKTIFAYTRTKGYDILVTFDADGQHEARDLPKVLQPIIEDNADVVIGTRWKTVKNVPFSRFIVNKFANLATYLLFGVWTTDSQSGFRAFGKKAIQDINLQADGMEVSSEFFREIYRNKLVCVEVPIHAIYSNYSKAKGQKLTNAPNVFFQLLLRLLR